MELTVDGKKLPCLSLKMGLRMKITAFLILVAALQVSARGTAQITLSEKKAPLEKVLKEIKRQSGYTLFYDQELLGQWGKPVDVNVNNVPVLQALDAVFQNQVLTYEVTGTMILVKEREAPSKKETPAHHGGDTTLLSHSPGKNEVHGVVYNESGQPLAGATVTLKGTKKGGITNNNGEFILQGVAPGKYILQISFVGYGTYEKGITVTEETTDIIAVMRQVITGLDEIQVIAYGEVSKRLQTGDVSTVKGADIEKQPVNNPLLALEGRVPGLLITENTGVPGGGITIRIQGQNSLSRGTDPLYVIDGVPYISQMLPNISGTSLILGANGNTNPTYAPSGGGNPLSFINPSDIESIEVLKDADATAIYGSRAANGAVLLTTKKGKSGRTNTKLNFQDGWGKVTRMLPLLNTQQYLTMRREAFKNDGSSAGVNDYDINGTWDTARYTDWQKTLIGGTARYTDAQASVSGGTDNTTFLVSADYHRETTVFPGNSSDRKGSVHFNFNHTSLSRKFRIQLTGNYMVDNNQLIRSDLTLAAIRLAPDAPALYNSDGSLNWAPLANGKSSWLNPLAALANKYTIDANNLISSALLSYQIFPGLEIKSNLGYNKLQINEININPLSTYAPENRPNTSRVSVFENSDMTTWNIEPQITYKHNISKGIFEALVGTTFLETKSNLQQFTAIGFNSDAVMKDIRAASSVSVTNTLASTYRYNAVFGRINFNWKDKYVVNLTGRRDGSSRFGPTNLLQNFGSLGGAWLFSNEPLLQRNTSFLSFGKLRVSYGLTGNDQIGDYQFMSLYNPYSVANAYQGITALVPAGLPNPHLQWEETRKLQAGIDLGVLRDRILLSANYYRNRSSNLLQEYALPIFTGNSSIQRNFMATVQNSGWEFSVSTKNIDSKYFSWSSGVNLTVPKNNLVQFPGLATSSYASTYVVGQPITSVKAFLATGVNPSTGLYQYTDSHGAATSTPNFSTDRTVSINIDPKVYGGFQNTFRYKELELDVLFQFEKQKARNYFLGNSPGRFSSGTTSSAIGNQPTYVMNRWQKTGDITNVQRFSSSYPTAVILPYIYATFSTEYYSEASFIRLKNLSLSYRLPEKLVKRVHLQNAKFYLQGQNLVTITKYQGMDPENNNVNSLPPLKMLIWGIQIGL